MLKGPETTGISGKNRIIIRRIELKPMKKDRKYRELYVDVGNREYKYTGAYYRFDLPAEKIGTMKLLYSAMALLTAILFIAAGFINNQGSRVIYVVLPYVALLLPIGFMLWDVAQIVLLKGDMTQKQYDCSVVQLRTVATASAILSFLASIGDIVYMAVSAGGEHLGKEILFLILVMLVGILNMIFISIQKNYICKKIA